MKTRIIRMFDTSIPGYIYAIEAWNSRNEWERVYGSLHTDLAEAEIHAKKIANGDMSNDEYFVVATYECSRS